MQVLVVGGAESLIKGNLGRRLEEHDITVGWHVAYQKHLMDQIPLACEGVIIIHDMCSHIMSDKAVLLAGKRGLPLAAIPRKWSLAEPTLRSRGFLPPASNGASKEPTEEEMLELVKAYICEERRRGHEPTLVEAAANLQVAFGPQRTLLHGVYLQARNMAHAEVPVMPPSFKDLRQKITDTAMLLVEDRPGRLLDYNIIIQDIRKELGETSVNIKQGDLLSVVEALHTELFRTWNPGNRTHTAGVDARTRTLRVWLRQEFEAFVRGEAPWPGTESVRKQATRMFGVQPRADDMIEARAAALGEWARDMEGSQVLYEKYQVALNMPYEDFLALLQKGEIKGLKPGTASVWRTSSMAVDEYLKKKQGADGWPAWVTQKPVAPVDVETAIDGMGLVVDVPVADPVTTIEVAPAPAPIPTFDMEGVTLAIGQLIEESLTKKLQALLAPVLSEVQQLKEHFDQRVEALWVETGSIKEGFRGHQANLSEQTTNMAEAISGLSQLVENKQKALSQMIVESVRVLAAGTQSIQDNLASLKGRDESDLSLRNLAKLASEAGLNITIQAAPRNS